jgi:predicted CopG family antitoxin
MSSKFKNIVVSEANYNVLKNLGSTGESFNDVLTEVLNKVSKVSFVGESNAG